MQEDLDNTDCIVQEQEVHEVQQKTQYHTPTGPGPIDIKASMATSTPSPISDADTASSSASGSLFSTPASPQIQSPLLRTPIEIIQKVLIDSASDDIPNLARAARTCRELRAFVYECPDQALWRDIHLNKYDDPRHAGSFVESRNIVDWKQRLQDREFVGRIFREWGEDRYDELPAHFDLICNTLLEMYLDLPAGPDGTHSNPYEIEEPRNSSLLSTYLRTPLFHHLYYKLSLKETRPFLRSLRGNSLHPDRRPSRKVVNPNISRLHVLLNPDFVDIEDHRTHRGYLREMVYSNINFGEFNDWGPFSTDGKVDWALVDAIGSVMMGNAVDVLAMGEETWRQALSPMSYGLEPVRGWGFNHLQRPAELGPDEVWDWAGVQGVWCGSYAFLDYADWISLNEPRLVMLRRSLNQLDLSRYNEAIGDLMRLELVIDGTDSPGTTKSHGSNNNRNNINEGLPKVETHLPTSNLLPPIRFHGSSVQQIGAMTYPSGSPASFVRGVVQLTNDNPPQVRWTLVIRYGGEDRWRLECVQVGGRGSKRGFFGIWTDAAKEEHSPNGPVWYWKP